MDSTVPKGQTALLIVDVQNDFCAADGKMAGFGVDLSTIDPAVDRIERLATSARRSGVPVIFIRLVTMPETDSKALLALYARQGIGPEGAAVCRKDTAGADYYRVFPQPGDRIVDKQRYSGFADTNLQLMLSAAGIVSLVVTGVTTECCVDSTVRDGFMRDYEVFVASDACAAYEPDLHEASLKSLGLNFATLLTTEEVLAGWEKAD
ncbi:cysteine hydrolase family protein [Paenibacillus sp. NPDC058174]|uniref:cysteine hydrolase family protein n=1 Tax=Paenibacillus sp. NPDC058174 TaxID=3346366 RepID=UPI0036D7FEB6